MDDVSSINWLGFVSVAIALIPILFTIHLLEKEDAPFVDNETNEKRKAREKYYIAAGILFFIYWPVRWFIGKQK